MSRVIRTLAILLCLGSAALADVGKEELKKLSQAGLSDDFIVSYARSKAPLQRFSADDVVELKKAGLSDGLLTRLMDLQEPPSAAPTSGLPSSTAAATAKLLSDPSVVYDGRYFYPRSYFSSDHAAYSSAGIGITVSSPYPGWYLPGGLARRWSYGVSYTFVSTGFSGG